MSVAMSLSKAQSLVEQKRLQWAREREELTNFYGLWGSNYPAQSSLSKNQIFSASDLTQRNLNSECRAEFVPIVKETKKRSPSLPPISSKATFQRKEQIVSNEDQEAEPEDIAGEETTSGYNSDSGGNEANQLPNGDSSHSQRAISERPTENGFAEASKSGPVASADTEEGMVRNGRRSRSRSKSRSCWKKDRMNGSMSESSLVDINFTAQRDVCFDTNYVADTGEGHGEPPNWLEKKLDQLNCNYDLIKTKVDGMPAKHVEFKGSTDTIYSQDGSARSFIRGQNLPLTTEEVIEREKRRQKALEHQNAIKEQLSEKEQKKREERERKLLEEIEEETRLQRQQELEQKRLEAEEFKRKFKQEQEMRKAELMKEALRQAERLAKEAKTRLKIKPFTSCPQIATATITTPRMTTSGPPRENYKAKSGRRSRVMIEVQPQSQPQITPKTSPRIGRNEEDDLRQGLQDKKEGASPSLKADHWTGDGIDRRGDDEGGVASEESRCPLGVEEESLSSPPSSPRSISSPSAAASVSITVKAPRDAHSHPHVSVSLSPNRVPSMTLDKHRETVDRSTQTESDRDSVSTYHRENRLPLRWRAQSRHRPPQIEPLSERPKWGVNRPCVRYVKQSEKDPHYQKRRRLRRLRLHSEQNNDTSDTKGRYPHSYVGNQDFAENGGRYFERTRRISQDSLDADEGSSKGDLEGHPGREGKGNKFAHPRRYHIRNIRNGSDNQYSSSSEPCLVASNNKASNNDVDDTTMAQETFYFLSADKEDQTAINNNYPQSKLKPIQQGQKGSASPWRIRASKSTHFYGNHLSPKSPLLSSDESL